MGRPSVEATENIDHRLDVAVEKRGYVAGFEADTMIDDAVIRKL